MTPDDDQSSPASGASPKPTPDPATESEPSNKLGAIVHLWATAVIVLLVVAGFVLVSGAYLDKLAAIERHAARSDPGPPPASRTAATPGDPTASPVEVKVGMYLDRVVNLSVKETGWTADFYLWFSWRKKELDPGASFRIVGGDIEQKDTLKTEDLPDGSRYALYRVRARITKAFDVSRFPADDHLLNINLEDAALTRDRLQFVADTANSAVSSRVQLPGYRIQRVSAIVKPHAYKTTLGDPRLAKGTQAEYSQYSFGIWIARDGWAYFFKVFQGLYAAVAVALLAFFIKPTDVDPRFGLGVGGFFGAIANGYIIASLLPDTGIVSLADKINGLGLAMIFLTLVQSTISLYLYDIRGEEALSRRFDRVSVLILIPGYIILNVLIAWAAAV